MGPIILIMNQPIQRKVGPPIQVGHARILVFNSLTPLFVYGNLSTNKTWVNFC